MKTTLSLLIASTILLSSCGQPPSDTRPSRPAQMPVTKAPATQGAEPQARIENLPSSAEVTTREGDTVKSAPITGSSAPEISTGSSK